MKKQASFALTLVSLLAISTGFIFPQNVKNSPQATNTVTITNYYQTDELTNSYPHYLGISGGMTTGYGISFRYWDDWGFQITALPIIMDTIVNVNIGISVLKELYDAGWSKLFVYAGTSAIYSKGFYTYAVYDYSTYSSYGGYGRDSVGTFSWNIGFGPGIEFYIMQNLCLDLMFGMAMYNNIQTYWRIFANLTVEGSIFFRF